MGKFYGDVTVFIFTADGNYLEILAEHVREQLTGCTVHKYSDLDTVLLSVNERHDVFDRYVAIVDTPFDSDEGQQLVSLLQDAFPGIKFISHSFSADINTYALNHGADRACLKATQVNLLLMYIHELVTIA